MELVQQLQEVFETWGAEILSKKEREIWMERSGANGETKTFKTIADEWGVSPARAVQTYNKARRILIMAIVFKRPYIRKRLQRIK